MGCKHKLQVLAMLGGDEKTGLSYIIVATTAVMLARCDFLQYNRLRSVSTSTPSSITPVKVGMSNISFQRKLARVSAGL